MDKVLRDIVLGLGVVLGIIRTEDPQLSARVFRDEQRIYVNLDLARAFSKEAERLLDSGTELLLIFTVAVEGRDSRRLEHGITFDPIRKAYAVNLKETQAEHRTQDKEAAMDIASKIYGYPLLGVDDFDPRSGLAVSATCEIQATGMDAAVLWNYKVPVARLAFDALSGIPR